MNSMRWGVGTSEIIILLILVVIVVIFYMVFSRLLKRK